MLIDVMQLNQLTDPAVEHIDLRQMLILGSVDTQHASSSQGYPVIADFREKTSNWKGGLLLGGSTDRLQRHFGNNFKLGKIISYRNKTVDWSNGRSSGSEIMEYLSIIDPNNVHLIYKCRRHYNENVTSYIFPENIDKFASGLTNHAWFQTPICAMLSSQFGHSEEKMATIFEDIYSVIDDGVIWGNLLTVDHYATIPIVAYLTNMINDVESMLESSGSVPEHLTYSDPDWLTETIMQSPPSDSFFKRMLLNGVVDQHMLQREIGPHTLDLTVPESLTYSAVGQLATIPIDYLTAVEQLERLPCTDLKITMEYLINNTSKLIIHSLVDRFIAVLPWRLQFGYTAVLLEICNTIYATYSKLNPDKSNTLLHLTITKTFNEEALIEFSHSYESYDHAMYINFALLSYCSVGCARFFTSTVDIPT